MKSDIIIFSGQSNMQGQTERLPSENLPVPNSFEYRYAENKLISLIHPVGESLDINGQIFIPDFDNIPDAIEKSVLLSSWENNANMVPFFCRQYNIVTGLNVVAVHAAKGSTTIDYWLPGNLGYTFLEKKASAAIKNVCPLRVFFVWLQGESDAIAGTSSFEYKRKLTLLNNALRNDIGIEKFGIILVGEFTGDSRDSEIINAQKEICAENADFLLLTGITGRLTKDKEYMNPYVNGHFSCKGQEEIGLSAGRMLGNYAKKSVNK